MKNNNIKFTDNELKIDINILKEELSKMNVSYDDLEEYNKELAANVFTSRVYFIFLLILVPSVFFVSHPVILGIISLLINFRRNQINKDIIILEEKVNKEYQKINQIDKEITLKKFEIEFKENILNYRNGTKLNYSKINDLNELSLIFSGFEHEIKEINEKYNYDINNTIIEENEWVFKPYVNKYIDEARQKVLKRKWKNMNKNNEKEIIYLQDKINYLNRKKETLDTQLKFSMLDVKRLIDVNKRVKKSNAVSITIFGFISVAFLINSSFLTFF